MEKLNYINVRDLQDFPSFHDAELFQIEHRRDDRELELGFRRVNGEIEFLLFTQVISQRMVDFTEQNVASRLLLSPKHSFSVSEVRTLIGWVRSYTDSKPASVSDEQVEQLHHALLEGTATLFTLDPSCGAEMVVLCESAWLRQR
ncbi:hypothetical protein [Paraburkholderia susongensis]|uniref:hypothetical protein n=1 Tax=Paraburkholderia susongensis TaxID=1515439 RepID=UPI000A1CB0EF|nr:hypothetical protein [Paraburkholderia susongensis]